VRLRLPNVLVRVGEAHAPVPDEDEGLLRRLWWLPGWLFAAVTIFPALLAVAWLVPGTGMLLAGRLLPLPMVIMFVPVAVALCYFAMRRLPDSWPRAARAVLTVPRQPVPAPRAAIDPASVRRPAGSDPAALAAAGRRPAIHAAALLAAIAVAAGFGLWQALYASQQVFVASDPGVYLQYGFWIAEHGSVHIPASPGNFGTASGLDFATTGFIVSGNSITPAYLPGLPLVLAAGQWLGGLGGALLMPAVLGGAAVLSFGGLVGRLCGGWWAVAAEVVLAVSLPEIYTARTPFSEPLVQLLLFGGLCLFTDALVVRRRGRGGAAFGAGNGIALAAFGGLALGLTALASIGSLLFLLPAFPVLALLFAARRPQAAPFGIGLILGLATGLLAALVLARPYLSTMSPQLHLIGLCAAGFGLATALIAPLAFPAARARVRSVCAVQLQFKWFGGEQLILPTLGTVLTGLAVAVPAVALVVLLARPYLETVRGQTDPAVIREVAALQRLEGLPADGRRQYYESSLNWVFWYLGVPAVLLACTGAAVLGRRMVRMALRTGPADIPAEAGQPADDRASALPLWVLPFLIIGWSVVTVLWDPAVVPWQPLASHRLVPVVLPGLLLLAVWVSSRLTAHASLLGASRAAVVLVAACCVLALVIPPLVTTLNPGLANKPTVGPYSSGVARYISRVELRGVGASATYGGSLAAASSLCTDIGPSASVLFTDERTAQAYAPVVRDLCGQPAAALVPAATSPGDLERAASAIERTGRRPVILGPTAASVALPGSTPRHAVALQTSGDAKVLSGPPSGNWPVSYSLWLATPPGYGPK
jgi:hypothetical protein